jgi:hypothetical protein
MTGPVPLHAPPHPCSTCPYRTDTPAGIWDRSEYAKLPDYDGVPGALATFHCHQEHATSVPTVCRGWLTVHADGIAVRLAIARGEVTPAQRDAPVNVELYPSGVAAARAGLAGVDDPSSEAVSAMRRLSRRLPAAEVWP